MGARLWIWLYWFVLAFGIMNVYAPPQPQDDVRQESAPFAAGQAASPKTAAPPVLNLQQIFLNYQRGGADVEMYFAYANALLGRPYLAKYVRLTDEAKSVAVGAGDVVRPTRPLLPWRDFLVEYPPGMLVPVVAPALFTSNFPTYFLLFSLEMELALTLAVALAVKTANALAPGSGDRALGLSIVLTLALGCIAVRRYDPCVALAMAVVVYGMATRRPILACVALAIGVALKGVPLLLAPTLLFWFMARKDWRGLRLGAASAGLCLGAVALVYAAVAGPHALDVFVFHASRPLQLETPYSGALMLLTLRFPDLAAMAHSYGSDNLASAAEPSLRTIATLLEIAALVAVYALVYPRIRAAADDRKRLLAALWAFNAALVAYMSLGKVFSPQYLTWLLPLGAIAGAASPGAAVWRLVVANAFTQVDFPFLYGFGLIRFQAFAPAWGAVVLARSVALWSWIAALFRESAR